MVLISYQLDFVIPGISPLLANSLKQILQRPNFLINPLLRPHLKQRLIILELYFGFFFDFAIWAVVVIVECYFLIGKPNNLNNSNPSSLFLALVTKVTSRPKIVFSFSVVISEKAISSLKPTVRLPLLSIDFD